LHTDLDDISETLEERDQIGLSDERYEVTDVDRSVEGGSLRDDGFVLQEDKGRQSLFHISSRSSNEREREREL
jgi:hypothetical protein